MDIDGLQGSLSRTLFVSDLDGTLLTSEKGLVAGQSRTLNHLLAEGLQFTVATARSIQAVNVLLKDLNLSLPAITLGGSLVTWPATGEHLVARVIPRPAAERLFTLLSARGLLPFVASIERHREEGLQDLAFYSCAASDAARWYVEEKQSYGDPRLRWYDTLSEVLDTCILTMTTFVEQETLAELIRNLQQVKDTRISSMPARHFPGWHEVTASHPDADKGAAVESLCHLLGPRWDRVVAFGDDVNDLPLFQHADLAIAVANAAPEVLAQADQVIQGNDAGSVIEYLSRFFYNNGKL